MSGNHGCFRDWRLYGVASKFDSELEGVPGSAYSFARNMSRLIAHAFAAYFLAAVSCRAASIIVPVSAVGYEGGSNISAAYWLQGRTQQVINASEFDGYGPALLQSVGYRSDSVFWSPIDVTFTDLSIRISTTRALAQGLSSFYDENLGSDLVEVFSGDYHLTTNGTYRQFATVFTFDTPFLYDPTIGNLLIEFRFRGGIIGSISEYIAFDRIGYGEGTSTGSTSGLRSDNPLATMTSDTPYDPPILQFTFSEVPEPCTGLLVGVGVLLACRRFRKQEQQ